MAFPQGLMVRERPRHEGRGCASTLAAMPYRAFGEGGRSRHDRCGPSGNGRAGREAGRHHRASGCTESPVCTGGGPIREMTPRVVFTLWIGHGRSTGTSAKRAPGRQPAGRRIRRLEEAAFHLYAVVADQVSAIPDAASRRPSARCLSPPAPRRVPQGSRPVVAGSSIPLVAYSACPRRG